MKANYENWVPKGMATGFAAGAAALAAGSALLCGVKWAEGYQKYS